MAVNLDHFVCVSHVDDDGEKGGICTRFLYERERESKYEAECQCDCGCCDW